MVAFWAELAPTTNELNSAVARFTALLDDMRRLSPSLATQMVDTDDVAQPCAVGRAHSRRGWGSHVTIDTLSAVSVGIMFLCVFVGRWRVLLSANRPQCRATIPRFRSSARSAFMHVVRRP